MRYARRWILALIVLFMCAAAGSEGAARAEDASVAEDITELCEIVSTPNKTTTLLRDRKYTSRWISPQRAKIILTVRAPEERRAGSAYICFGELPKRWEIQIPDGELWVTYAEGDTRFLHAFVELPEAREFRLVAECASDKIYINELFVFSPGEVPDWVQRWEPTPEKADLLLLAAHPDDELVFMGGAAPTYAVERGMDVVVAYMTASNTTRSSELLNGLWHMGIRQYPVIGPFSDRYTSDLEAGYRQWGTQKARSFVMELIRRYRPEVMVSHDPDGEYGHGAHEVCADAALYCAERSANAGVMPEIAEQYGTWTLKKLYLHLYPKRRMTMNWRIPLQNAGGKTSLELAQEAYEFHITQHKTRFEVTDEGEYSNALFGLAYTTVGDDERCDDFFENVVRDVDSRRTESLRPTPYPALFPTPDPTPAFTLPFEATPEPTPEPTATPEPIRVFAPANLGVEWPQKPEALNAKGFLEKGEYVYTDAIAGLWFYASPTLVVRIDRKESKEDVLTWYEAHVFVDLESGERFGSTLLHPEDPTKEHVQPARLAREKQVVFGMSTDYYTYRMGRNAVVGVVIRDGKILHDTAPQKNRSKFPNLDTLAMYADGRWGVYHSDEYTAQQYLDMGAVDVYSFGPFLVRDGELNPFVEEMGSGKTGQPRCAVGMIEPGHYYAMLAEGGMRKVSQGVTVQQLAEHMRAAGCQQALNLDGGQTAVMLFMGNQISRIGQYSGGKTLARATTEIMGVGHSARITPLRQ